MPILHFSDAELKNRQLAARKAMQDLKLDGLLMFPNGSQRIAKLLIKFTHQAMQVCRVIVSS